MREMNSSEILIWFTDTNLNKILILFKIMKKEGEYKASFDSEGKLILKSKIKIKKGKSSRAAGGRFESIVRKDFESKGWIIDKWTNNVDLEKNILIPSKRKFNPFMKIMSIGTGFPDFIALKPREFGGHDVIGIEVKMKGLLDKTEKEKARWYLDKGIFSKIVVSKKGEKRGEIEHIDFKEKWGK